jgi:hypothetical protein
MEVPKIVALMGVNFFRYVILYPQRVCAEQEFYFGKIYQVTKQGIFKRQLS